jgi:hypothetical protein
MPLFPVVFHEGDAVATRREERRLLRSGSPAAMLAGECCRQVSYATALSANCAAKKNEATIDGCRKRQKEVYG